MSHPLFSRKGRGCGYREKGYYTRTVCIYINVIKNYIEEIEYDDYDKLIILCDALADASGFCILEKRFVDTTRRYGIYPFTLDRWNKTYEYKEYFENRIGKPIYALLPDVEKCIYQ